MTLVYVFFTTLIVLLVLGLLKNRRKKLVAFPSTWKKLLLEHVPFYKELKPEEQKRFQQRMTGFLNETYVEGVGISIEDLDKILVAASAIIPVFGFPEWHYSNLSSVLLYPDNFNEDLEYNEHGKNKMISGLVGNGQFAHQMILSKKALYDGFSSSTSSNTGIHEFVHLIDKLDGAADGVPERILREPYIIPWLKLIHHEMEDNNNNQSDIRKYGGTNEAEFLAVASEYFFEKPEKFKRNHPELYRMLSACFQTQKH